jgi:CheY-like chemotaxis protein
LYQEEAAMRILVIDDQPEYRLMLRDILMVQKWDVILAANGEEGLQRLTGGAIDIVISDIYMPVMDGIKLHRTVRETPQWASLPFLFISGFDDEHTRNAAKDPRVDGFFRKTAPIEELVEWVKYLTAPIGKQSRVPPGALRAFPRPPR